MPVEAAPTTCRVCGDPAGDGDSATCNICHRPFHLRLRQDSDGPECGAVWVDEQFLRLEHACDVCLGRRAEPGAAEPPVGAGH